MRRAEGHHEVDVFVAVERPRRGSRGLVRVTTGPGV